MVNQFKRSKDKAFEEIRKVGFREVLSIKLGWIATFAQ